MARTKATARRSTGGSAVRLQLCAPSSLPYKSAPNHTSSDSLSPRSESESSRHSIPELFPGDLVKLGKELEDARAQIRELESDRQNLRNLAEAAEIHCYFVNKVLQDTRRELNGKSTTQCIGAKKLNTMPHTLAYEGGQAEKEEWQRRLEVLQEKAKEDLERQRKRGQQSNSAVFSGALHQKKKEELSDIAACLHLDEQGTVAVLIERIKTFLQANPAIRYSERYASLELHHPHLRGTKRTTPDHPDDNLNSLLGSSQHKRTRASTSTTSNLHTTSSPAMSPFAARPI